jgi:pilus assembly protein CpaC
MMRNYLALAALSSGLALSIISVRAAEPLTPASPSGAAGAEAAATTPSDLNRPARATMVPPSGSPIVLEAGKGTLIRLPRPASTVFIANPETADVQIKSPSLIYVTAKAPGQTSLYAVDAEDRILLNAPVRVEHDLSRVRQTLGAVAPGENVSVSSVDNALVLSGNVSSAGRAERVRSHAAAIASETKGNVVNRMSVATPNQVNIRVKVAEVNRSVLKSLGVNWQKLGGFGALGQHINFLTDNPTAVAGIPATTNLAVGFGGPSWFTTALVDALAQEGLTTILAEPNLTATNGQPASFLAGGEFPVPVASAITNNIQTVTVEFKKFGVSLDVTPTIVDPEHLSLRVRSEVSQLSTLGAVTLNNIQIPALSVRRAETTVELGSGQSFMLAGLLQNSDAQNVSKVPALGDIPVLGQLFRSEQFQRNETELVLIVTPYLVQPAPRVANLALPTDGLRAPHDIQKVIHGSMYRQGLPTPPKGPVEPGGRAVIGPVGFRMD